jgi:hypothetical protein
VRHLEQAPDLNRLLEISQIGGVYYFRYSDPRVRNQRERWIRNVLHDAGVKAQVDKVRQPGTTSYLLRVNIGPIVLPKIAEEDIYRG